MILTDEEISRALLPFDRDSAFDDIARAIEAAIMAKFEAVTMVKPPMYLGTVSNEITKHLPPFTQLYALKEKP